LTVIDDLVVF